VSTAVANFTTVQQLPVGESSTIFPSIAGNALQPGSALDIEAFGVFGTSATPPTLILGVYYGGTGTPLAVSGAITPAASLTNVPWRLKYTARVVTGGTSGTIIGQGFMMLGNAVSTWAGTINPLPITALANVTIDTTTQKTIAIGATWSVANAAHTITCHGMDVKISG
jgi:hypothetical protein